MIAAASAMLPNDLCAEISTPVCFPKPINTYYIYDASNQTRFYSDQ